MCVLCVCYVYAVCVPTERVKARESQTYREWRQERTPVKPRDGPSQGKRLRGERDRAVRACAPPVEEVQKQMGCAQGRVG
jgi:hypothetical protein